MAEFKLSISQKDGKAFRKGLSGKEADALIGKKLGEAISGDSIGLPGYELQLTGGSDSGGFPMRAGFHGAKVLKILLSDGPGFNSKFRGDRRKKRIRGGTVTESIVQVNLNVTKEGKDKLDKLLAEEQGAVEKTREEKLAEKKEEIKAGLEKEGEATAAEAAAKEAEASGGEKKEEPKEEKKEAPAKEKKEESKEKKAEGKKPEEGG